MQPQARPMPMAAGTYSYPGQAPRPAVAMQSGYGQPVYTTAQPQRVGVVPGQAQPKATMTAVRPGGVPTSAYGGQPVYSQVGQPQPMPVSTFAHGQPMPAYTTRPVMSASPSFQTPAQTYSSRSAAAQPNVVAGPAYTQASYEEKHHDDAQLQNLKELRRTCGLKTVPVGDGLNTLKAFAVDGQLSREQFLQAYSQLLQQHGIPVPNESVQNAVFDLFDRDDNHVVDMMEVICGISLLCSGSEEDKIHAVFNIFDENGDGFISMDEMFKFLTSVFKVVLTPQVMAVMNTMGVTVESAEDLASVTALECFKTADLNHDGRLSVVEFKNWFNAPRNDPSFLFSPVRKLLQ